MSYYIILMTICKEIFCFKAICHIIMDFSLHFDIFLVIIVALGVIRVHSHIVLNSFFPIHTQAIVGWDGKHVIIRYYDAISFSDKLQTI